MSLTFKKSGGTYFWPVEILSPMDGGKFQKQTFDAEFKRIAQSRVDQLVEMAKAEQLSDADLLAEVWVGWRGVKDEEGELPFSETNREALLDAFPGSRAQLIKGFFASLQGVVRKN